MLRPVMKWIATIGGTAMRNAWYFTWRSLLEKYHFHEAPLGWLVKMGCDMSLTAILLQCCLLIIPSVFVFGDKGVSILFSVAGVTGLVGCSVASLISDRSKEALNILVYVIIAVLITWASNPGGFQ